MKLSQLKYFKTVAECGRISLAAKKLFISAPALSTAILSLENELGVTLFDRTSNQIVLNEQGRIFLRYVNQMFDCLECAERDLQSSLQKRGNSIHIGVTTSSIWTSLLSAFALEYPDISLSCTTLKPSQMVPSALAAEYSFILAEHNDFSSFEWESAFLYREDLFAVVPKNHPLASYEELQIKDLINELLFLPMAGQSFNKRIMRLFAEKRLTPKHVHEYADATCLSMVREGRGICFATNNSIGSDTADTCRIPIADSRSHWEQWMYWVPHRKMTPEEVIFKDFVFRMYGVER